MSLDSTTHSEKHKLHTENCYLHHDIFFLISVEDIEAVQRELLPETPQSPGEPENLPPIPKDVLQMGQEHSIKGHSHWPRPSSTDVARAIRNIPQEYS